MKLGDFPSEILEDIALAVVSRSPLGPPRGLLNILLTCRQLYDKLSPHNCPRLYLRIFMTQFDSTTPLVSIVRDGFSIHAQDLVQELRLRFSALALFAAGSIDDPKLPDALMTAFFMILEDAGCNSLQLRHAGLSGFLGRYIRQKIPGNDQQWPLQDCVNSLVLFLFWAMSSDGMSYLLSMAALPRACLDACS
jgi:hypothetical protein